MQWEHVFVFIPAAFCYCQKYMVTELKVQLSPCECPEHDSNMKERKLGAAANAIDLGCGLKVSFV